MAASLLARESGEADGQRAKSQPIEKLRATNKMNTMIATATQKRDAIDEIRKKASDRM